MPQESSLQIAVLYKKAQIDTKDMIRYLSATVIYIGDFGNVLLLYSGIVI